MDLFQTMLEVKGWVQFITLCLVHTLHLVEIDIVH